MAYMVKMFTYMSVNWRILHSHSHSHSVACEFATHCKHGLDWENSPQLEDMLSCTHSLIMLALMPTTSYAYNNLFYRTCTFFCVYMISN